MIKSDLEYSASENILRRTLGISEARKVVEWRGKGERTVADDILTLFKRAVHGTVRVFGYEDAVGTKKEGRTRMRDALSELSLSVVAHGSSFV